MEWLYSQETSVGKDMEKIEPLYTADGNVSCVAMLVKTVKGSL